MTIAKAKFHLRKVAEERKDDPRPREGDFVATVYWQHREDDRRQREQRWEAYLP